MQGCKAVFFWAAILGLASSTAAYAKPPVRTPTAKWTVDFDRSRCVAARNYGTIRDPIVLVLKAPALGEVMQLGIIRTGKGGQYAEQMDAVVSIDGAAPIKTTLVAAMTAQPNQKLYRLNMPMEQFKAVGTAKTLTIESRRELSESLVLTDMESLNKILAECVLDLRKVWNVSEDGRAPPGLKQRARGNLAGLMRSEDYPAIAMNKSATGSVQLGLLIDETGRVADCTVADTSGVAALDEQSCAIVTERARLTPAIGLDGKPARDSLYQRIMWAIK